MSNETPKWELAYIDYINGLKTKEIAKKYEVSDSTVRSWKNRYWNKKHSNKIDATSQQVKSVATKNRGGQIGNTNSLKHGAYAKQYIGLLELDLIHEIMSTKYTDPISELKYKLNELKLREVYLQNQILKITNTHNFSGVVINNEVEIKRYKHDVETTKEIHITKEALHLLLTPLEIEITKVQKNIIKTIEMLSKLEKDNFLDKTSKVIIVDDVKKV